MTETNRYGDAPLGKSDEELREEGADALTNSERQSGHTEGSDVEIPVAVPVGGVASTGGMATGLIAPGLVVSDTDTDERRRDDD
jgi:hypothetical protein